MPEADTSWTATSRGLVILPAFNESESIGRVVEEIVRHLPGFDILVVDDGSTDATSRRVPGSAKLVTLPFNLGIGGAMQTGYRYAALHGYDIALQVDADGQHPPSEARTLVEHLEASGADMVIGSRFLTPGSYRQTWARMTGIRVLRSLIRVLAGKRINDCTSGFRAVNRKVIRAFAHWYPDDYPEPEVVLLLHRSGFDVEEVATEMVPRKTGSSSISLTHGVFYVIKVAVCLVLDMIRDPWPREKVGPS